MANRVRPITVRDADRRELERLQRSPSAPAGLTRRARAVLLMAQGVAGVEIAALWRAVERSIVAINAARFEPGQPANEGGVSGERAA